MFHPCFFNDFQQYIQLHSYLEILYWCSAKFLIESNKKWTIIKRYIIGIILFALKTLQGYVVFLYFHRKACNWLRIRFLKVLVNSVLPGTPQTMWNDQVKHHRIWITLKWCLGLRFVLRGFYRAILFFSLVKHFQPREK